MDPTKIEKNKDRFTQVQGKRKQGPKKLVNNQVRELMEAGTLRKIMN